MSEDFKKKASDQQTEGPENRPENKHEGRPENKAAREVTMGTYKKPIHRAGCRYYNERH